MKSRKCKRVSSSIQFLLLSVLVTGAIASCQSQTNNDSTSSRTDCRTIEHEVGETEVCNRPQKIVVLGPYVLEPLLALEVQPVAYADHIAFHQGDYDNPNEQIPYLGSRITQPIANVGIAYEPSIEAIVKAQPDLIIGLEDNAKQYETLSQIAPTILVDWTETETSLKAIAKAVDRAEKATQLLAETKQRIIAARETFAPFIASNPKLLLLSSSQLQQINLGNFNHGACSSLIEELGFELVSSPQFENSNLDTLAPISIETLPQFNEADLIVMLGHSFDKPEEANDFESHQLSKVKQAWQNNAIAQSLDASKSDRVYFIPSYLCLGLPGAIGTQLYLEELAQQLLLPQSN